MLEPLGDQGVLARLDSEEQALRFAAALRRNAPTWLIDVVQAYTTVAVFHDPHQITHAELLAALSRLDLAADGHLPGGPARRVEPRRPDAAGAGRRRRGLLPPADGRPPAVRPHRRGGVHPARRPATVSAQPSTGPRKALNAGLPLRQAG